MLRFIIAAVLFIQIAGCASTTDRMLQDKPLGNSRDFKASSDVVFSACKRALYDYNFSVEKADTKEMFLLGKKAEQEGRKTHLLLLQVRIEKNVDGASAYLNAYQTTEQEYVKDNTRFLLWIVPLPGGGGKEASSVKAGEKTVNDKKFYDRIFVKIADNISKVPAQEVVSEEMTPQPKKEAVEASTEAMNKLEQKSSDAAVEQK
jgi:hypothetical protein